VTGSGIAGLGWCVCAGAGRRWPGPAQAGPGWCGADRHLRTVPVGALWLSRVGRVGTPPPGSEPASPVLPW